MVRTYPVASLHFDPARVAAWSAAIALHLLAFLLLLIPATYQAVQVPREKTPVRLIEKIPPRRRRRCRYRPRRSSRWCRNRERSRWYRHCPRPPRPWRRPWASRCRPPNRLRRSWRPASTRPPRWPAPSCSIAAPSAGLPDPVLRNHEQGTVLLRVEVDSHGQPVAVSVERSSGSRNLDQAARQQVLRHWRFEPASVTAWPFRPSAWYRCSSRCPTEPLHRPGSRRAALRACAGMRTGGPSVTD